MRLGAGKTQGKQPGLEITAPWSLKPNDDASRQLEIVLRRVEETGLHVVSLEPPRHRRNEFVVDASAQGAGERSVRTASLHADVACADQSLGKRPEFPHRYRHARPEQVVVLG